MEKIYLPLIKFYFRFFLFLTSSIYILPPFIRPFRLIPFLIYVKCTFIHNSFYKNHSSCYRIKIILFFGSSTCCYSTSNTCMHTYVPAKTTTQNNSCWIKNMCDCICCCCFVFYFIHSTTEKWSEFKPYKRKIE